MLPPLALARVALLLAAAFLPSGLAFVSPTKPVTTWRSASLLLSSPNNDNDDRRSFSSDSFNDLSSRLPDMSQVSELLDIQSFMSNADTIRDNVMAGEFGKRGEAYVLAQVVLGLSVLAGGIPVIGDPVLLVAGPALMLVGAATIVLSILELGPALSPWPATSVNEEEDLVTDGILFGQLRHPIYGGILAFCFGLALATNSASRLVLSALLWYALDLKSNFEEEDLLRQFPAQYTAYQRQVPSKFVPITFLELLPWNK